MCGGPRSATAPICESAQAVRSVQEILIRKSFYAMKPSRGRPQWNTKGARADHERVHKKRFHSPERAPVPGGKRTVGMRQSLASFCRQYGRLNLLNEWDAERNLPLTPETVTHGAHHKNLVAVLKRPRMAGPGLYPHRRLRLPLLCRQKSAAGLQRSGFPISGAGKGVGYGEESANAPHNDLCRQQAAGLVEMRPGPQLAGPNPVPRLRMRLSCVRREIGDPRRE